MARNGREGGSSSRRLICRTRKGFPGWGMFGDCDNHGWFERSLSARRPYQAPILAQGTSSHENIAILDANSKEYLFSFTYRLYSRSIKKPIFSEQDF